MNEHAMTYESLIRRCYGKGRYGNSCADADIYRLLQHLFIERQELDAKNDTKALERINKKYQNELRKVIQCVIKAIETALKRFDSKLTTEDKSTLDQQIKLLANADKELLEKVMITAENLLVAHQIYPG